jgi:aldehyde:ferredoxin oxidoreductase
MEGKMKGLTGKLLRVNLSTGTVGTEDIPLQDIMTFIGGRGLAIKYLYDELAPGTDPLGEDNKLILCNGVLAGTTVQSASRWLSITKSPLTGCYARSSGGADFGAWLKFAGYDLIIIEGKSEKPVYLYITPDRVSIEDAREIWGLSSQKAQAWISALYGHNTRTACVGPAAENLVRYAAIVSGRRTASRCGTGTVMASKNLKAISINAPRNISVHDPERLKTLISRQIEILRSARGFQGFRQGGTTGGAISRNALGVYPTRNFRQGRMDGFEELSGEKFKELKVGNAGCYSCGARCGQVHTVKDGPYKGAHSEGPEYESVWAFTGTIDSNNKEAAIAADELCDELGMDTISTGSCIGFAFELYEKGILTKADTDGLDLTYGNHAAMISLIKKIAKREGFGDILADGTVRAAQRIGKGSEYYAMQVKGLELPAYEPRGLKATGFGYATSSIGGSHGNGSLAFQEMGVPVPRAVDRFSEEDKADIVIYNQNRTALRETGILCAFSENHGGWIQELFPEMLVAATGIEEFGSWEYVNTVGERIVNMDRVFNVREGFDRRHDTLPQRVQTEPVTHTGVEEGEGQMVRNLDKFLDEYYEMRGWSPNGIPTPEKLEELGLNRVAEDMKKYL